MAAACFPKAQSKVQEELENVIGRERCEFFFFCEESVEHSILMLFLAPICADQEMLPQTAAFVLETFRWRPVSAGGMLYIQGSKFIGLIFMFWLFRICS